jgi:hypothetical protein
VIPRRHVGAPRPTAKRYPGDNRLIPPKSPYRRRGLAPRCRLVSSWGRSMSQGSGCSPVKEARELGLERRETVNYVLSINLAICWNTRTYPAVLRMNVSHGRHTVDPCAVTIRQVIRTISREGLKPIQLVRRWRRNLLGRGDTTPRSEARVPVGPGVSGESKPGAGQHPRAVQRNAGMRRDSSEPRRGTSKTARWCTWYAAGAIFSTVSFHSSIATRCCLTSVGLSRPSRPSPRPWRPGDTWIEPASRNS